MLRMRLVSLLEYSRWYSDLAMSFAVIGGHVDATI